MGSLQTLVSDLKSLGLKNGDVVVVHSSLKSMGMVDGGADTVIDALIKVVGEQGTVLFPTLTFSPCYSTSKFSASETPSCVGKISETFRNRQEVIRSFHPTHSVCAYGKHALELTKDHPLDDTPVGPNSPYRKLMDYDGKILMLGCGLGPNTFMHGVEEVASAHYCLRDHQTYEMIDEQGNVYVKGIRRHNFNRPEGHLVQRYDRAIQVLDKGVDYFEGQVHGATAYLINAKTLCVKAVEKMKTHPYFFIDDNYNILK